MMYLRRIGALYPEDHARRLKVCVGCGAQFTDVTKRNLMHTCSRECQVAVMVAKRHERGNYAQTEEQKEKKRVSCTATYATRDVFGPKLRQRFSETMKKSWADGKIDVANHWSKTIEGRRRLSELRTGRKASDKARANQSIAAQNRVRSKRETLYTSAKGGTRQDLGCYFRSMWEANFARILTLQGRSWEYSRDRFN